MQMFEGGFPAAMTHPEKTTENVNRGERASSVLPKKRVEDGGFWFMLYGGKGDRGGRAIWMRVISNYCCILYHREGGKRAPVRDLIRCRWLDQSAGLAFLGCFSAAYTKRRVAARV